ncbi:hypothetical protein NC652_002889 [Populus alba x Populus x berolinensis]|uniref:Uncharacterized protein n=1 Tax=Populus alba x Populus x berolinensis TaxID=444605 RepID=A0AAD6RQA1_9ROSI|nr:hypothetical protein NC652_002889 [Populus alba x Populus x berolinensis]KAJ7013114.1 hypothetical protein NC653_002972 [Populus alba x Populus x berolinensis]
MIIEVLGHGKAKAKLFESFGMPYGAKNLLSSLLHCHFSSLKGRKKKGDNLVLAQDLVLVIGSWPD